MYEQAPTFQGILLCCGPLPFTSPRAAMVSDTYTPNSFTERTAVPPDADGDYLSTVRLKPEAIQGVQTGGFSLQTLTVSALIAGKLSSNA